MLHRVGGTNVEAYVLPVSATTRRTWSSACAEPISSPSGASRRSPLDAIEKTEIERRGGLEPHIESRISGIGTNYGRRFPNRHRVGPMLRRGTVGPECWAVRKGSGDQPLLVCHLDDHRYARLVLDVHDRDGFIARLRAVG